MPKHYSILTSCFLGLLCFHIQMLREVDSLVGDLPKIHEIDNSLHVLDELGQDSIRAAANKSHEKALIQTLLNRYKESGVLGRPLKNSKDIMEVRFGLALIQLLDLDENRQMLRTNCWLRYTWHDPLLNWTSWGNPHFSQLQQVRVYPDQIWTPDIKLYNFADSRLSEKRQARVVVYSDGTVLWVPQALFKSTCSVEIAYFPYDIQQCVLEFGSWTYDNKQLKLNWWLWNNSADVDFPYIDYNDYIVSNEWLTDGETERGLHPDKRAVQLRSQVILRNTTYVDSLGTVTNKSYLILKYRLSLTRNPAFYTAILILPCLLLSCITLVIFWLPPESVPKLQLGMNVFVAFFVLLLLLKAVTPSAAKTFPLIGGFFCLNMVLITCSTFLACIVVNFYMQCDRRGPMPLIVRHVIVDGLGWLLFVRQSIPLKDSKKIRHTFYSEKALNERSLSNCSGSFHKNKMKLPQLKYNKFDNAPSNSNVNQAQGDFDVEESPILGSSTGGTLEKDVREIKRYMRMYISRLKAKERKNTNNMEWRTFALVIDRLFFTIYVVTLLTACIVLLPRHKYLVI